MMATYLVYNTITNTASTIRTRENLNPFIVMEKILDGIKLIPDNSTLKVKKVNVENIKKI